MEKYLTLFWLTSINKNKLKLSCHDDGTYMLEFVISNWELGYDFLEIFGNHKKTFNQDLDKETLLNTYIHLAQKIEKWKDRKAKGIAGIRCAPSTLCNICKHRISYTTCKAFLSGIPSELHNNLHTEKHHTQKNDIVFELGEEGSKNINIKPINGITISHYSFTDDGIKELENIIEGIEEEKYYESN